MNKLKMLSTAVVMGTFRINPFTHGRDERVKKELCFQVPQFILDQMVDAGRGAECNIIVTQVIICILVHRYTMSCGVGNKP